MPNPYVNKVVQSNGTALIDISDTTAVAADVMEGKYFYLATGEKVPGTAESDGGGGGLEIENIVPEQTVNCTISLGTIYGGFINQHSALPQNGNYYLVTLNGTEYIARAFYATNGYLIVGDNRINQGADYTYVMFPFSIVNEGNYFYLSMQTSGAHTLKIDKILSWG